MGRRPRLVVDPRPRLVVGRRPRLVVVDPRPRLGMGLRLRSLSRLSRLDRGRIKLVARGASALITRAPRRRP